MHAHLGRHAGDQQGLDAAIAQHQVEVGLVERALAGLVDHGLAVDGVELGDDVVAGLAANENAAHGALVADAHGRRAALDLGARCVRQIGAMTFTRVDDRQPVAAGGAQQLAQGRDDFGKLRHIVAERLAETAGLEEVSLHVDDDECRPPRVDDNGRRKCIDARGSHQPAPMWQTN